MKQNWIYLVMNIDELEVLKRSFSLVLAVDYQMSKLVPYWGQSPQPGSTYYLQKLSHDIFGVVNHATNDSTVYLLDERVGPKNTDHTISYLTHYISQLPSWIHRIHDIIIHGMVLQVYSKSLCNYS